MAIGQFSGGSGAIVVAVTSILSGTDGRILYDNSGKVGEMTTTGSGTVVVLATGATLVTPALGVATATSLAIGGATIGSNALAVTGTQINSGYIQLTGATTSPVVFGATSNNLYLGANGNSTASTATFALLQDGVSIGLKSTGIIGFSSDTTPFGATDLFLKRSAAANLQLGAAAVDTAPVAQTLSVQNTLAGGTSNVAGANFTINGSQGKGTGVGGDFIVQIAPPGSTGTVVNPLRAMLRVASSSVGTVFGKATEGSGASVSFANGTASGAIHHTLLYDGSSNLVMYAGTSPVIATTNYDNGDFGVGLSVAQATTAVAGFLFINGGAGPPTGVPTNTGAGKYALYYDATNDQLYIYRGGWKQPKTPAAAAIVSWQ